MNSFIPYTIIIIIVKSDTYNTIDAFVVFFCNHLKNIILLMAKLLQYLSGICNMIEIWILSNCSGTCIATVYHRNGSIFDAIGYIHVIWIIIDTLHRYFTHSKDVNGNDYSGFEFVVTTVVSWLLYVMESCAWWIFQLKGRVLI